MPLKVSYSYHFTHAASSGDTALRSLHCVSPSKRGITQCYSARYSTIPILVTYWGSQRIPFIRHTLCGLPVNAMPPGTIGDVVLDGSVDARMLERAGRSCHRASQN